MNNVTLTSIVLTLLAASSQAQNLQMITSRDALRTYALEQSANVSVSIGSSLPLGNGAYGYVPVSSPTAVGISNTIHGISLTVDVANPADPLYTWASVYSNDGDPMFTGFHQFYLVNGKGGYGPPADYGNVPLDMYDTIPIKIDGALSAFVDILGANGQTAQEFNLDVRNGKVYYPHALTGTNAVLAVYIAEPTDGPVSGWQFWNVADGTPVQTEHYVLNVDSAIHGVVPVQDADVNIAVPTTNSIGHNLTAELTSSGKSLIGVSFWTTEGKWFKSAQVRKAGTTTWQTYTPVANKAQGLMMFELPVQTGVYYIIPEWSDGDMVEPADPYYPPYNDGGKG